MLEQVTQNIGGDSVLGATQSLTGHGAVSDLFLSSGAG